MVLVLRPSLREPRVDEQHGRAACPRAVRSRRSRERPGAIEHTADSDPAHTGTASTQPTPSVNAHVEGRPASLAGGVKAGTAPSARPGTRPEARERGAGTA